MEIHLDGHRVQLVWPGGSSEFCAKIRWTLVLKNSSKQGAWEIFTANTSWRIDVFGGHRLGHPAFIAYEKCIGSGLNGGRFSQPF
jgi:hypothetical protein